MLHGPPAQRDRGLRRFPAIHTTTNFAAAHPLPPAAMLASAFSAQRAPAPFVAAPKQQQRRLRASVRAQAADEVGKTTAAAAAACRRHCRRLLCHTHPRTQALGPRLPPLQQQQPPAAPEQQQQPSAATGGCPTCGAADRAFGCDGTGRIAGGIGAVPGFGWWPIKACECSHLPDLPSPAGSPLLSMSHAPPATAGTLLTLPPLLRPADRPCPKASQAGVQVRS